ncbi:PhoX family phosphatase [Marinobacter salinexigens]|uniref:PhoX family phosphatase n=1 Tax=Marinobacter salinexigens TaxID=2919747 RepID=A0A5B0VNH0_9GAMM|nr:PhoX family phosphatase [Marinobacter salinexigens]KAA1176242.1 PhoX family phosphatase [Marinobacter salinexigens]
MAKHDIDPNYMDPNYEPVVNHSDNTSFQQVLAARMGRRTVMKGTAGAALASVMGLGLVGCSDDDDDNTAGTDTGSNTDTGSSTAIEFKAVAVSTDNTVVVPEGYSAQPFLAWGTPITGSYPEYKNDGTNTGEEQEQQMGMHHDGMHFYPIDQKAGGNSSTEGLLVMNHEYINQSALHANGATYDVNGNRPADEVRKEIAAHGVSVVHIKQNDNGVWDIVFGSPFNRRVTGNTEMDIRGPLRGYEKLVTKYSNDGTETRGTLNNCSMGPTPWGTYLAAEENWHGYFANSDATQPREQIRHGVGSSSRYDWELADSGADQYVRFDISTKGATAQEDYRNEANTYGYMVEIDPFTPEQKPQKRTALGRFGHEGVIFAPAVEGQPIVCYSGDDTRFECIYKFVSKQPYYAATAGGYLLDEGTLYVARFNEDGSGDWLPLDLEDADFKAKVDAAVGTDVGSITGFTGFDNQAEIHLNTRLAADIAGGTPMDRPEWGAVDPNSGMVYFTLTNNSRRTEDDVNAANPNPDNQTGHIIRWAEADNDHTSVSFEWDIFVFGGFEGTETVVDGEAAITLTDENIFASPDGLWFDYNGRLWIQTDNGYEKDIFGNDMMLAANPETREIKRFFVGPQGCEVTGVTSTPDVKSMFVNIQHPAANWPDASDPRPRDACVLVTRDDGGVIGA